MSIDNLNGKALERGSVSKIEPGSLPGLLPRRVEDLDLAKWVVRYQKFNIDDPTQISELERIETRAIRNDGIFVLAKKDFVFMDQFFIMVQYLEKE